MSNGKKNNALSFVELEMGKMPPQAIDFEVAVLGGILLEAIDIYPNVSQRLNPELWYKESHRIIYEAIIQLANKKAPIDILTCTQELKAMGKLEEIGGAYYISQLTSKIASTANIDYHISILTEKALRRKQIINASETIERAYDETSDVFESIEIDTKNVNKLTDYVVGETSEFKISESIERTGKYLREPRKADYPGLPTGNGTISEALGGFQKSDLLILGGRPSEGKTDRALNFAMYLADEGIPVAFFSLETIIEHKINTRLLSRYSGIDNKTINKGNYSYDTDKALYEAEKRISKLPIHIFDQSTITPNYAMAALRKLKRNKGIKMAFFDYLQLIKPNEHVKGIREQEVSQICRDFKMGAKDLDMPIMLLSQLSRAVESNGKVRRPVISDLRESGAIEQDAEVVLLEFFPSKHWEFGEWNKDNFNDITMEEYPYLMETIIVKNKGGEAPLTVKEFYHKSTSTFYNKSEHVPKQLISTQAEMPF